MEECWKGHFRVRGSAWSRGMAKGASGLDGPPDRLRGRLSWLGNEVDFYLLAPGAVCWGGERSERAKKHFRLSPAPTNCAWVSDDAFGFELIA